MVLYELALHGNPSDQDVTEIESCLGSIIEPFEMRLGKEIAWSVKPATTAARQTIPMAVAYFGDTSQSDANLKALLDQGIAIVPVVSAQSEISSELPALLRPLNCLTIKEDGALRIATALLECVGLLPRQRRVFLSYKRDEARQSALQLFDYLSEKVIDVFLDTHGVLPGEEFQGVLWHKLCDSDVLVMLDTPNYFDSRWTTAEYGRALAKGISILRIGWPGVNPSRRAGTAAKMELMTSDIDVGTGHLSKDALVRIGKQIEIVRGRSTAVRRLNLFRSLKRDVECIGGVVTGIGLHNAIHLALPDGTRVIAYPTIGVPTSITLNDAMDHAAGQQVAIVFDHLGLQQQWLNHLQWLGKNIPAARWVKATEAAWTFAGWETL